MLALGKNIGYNTEQVLGFKNMENDFSKKQKEAWDLVKRSIDAGMPCYGWEMDIPEYYVVYGYDDDGYYFTGAGGVGVTMGEGYKPWRELGGSEIGVVEMYSVGPGRAADDTLTVKKGLEFALEHASEKWAHPNYRAGLAGYDIWIETLENHAATGHGMAFNTVVWTECRYYAVQFLKEAGERINGKTASLFEEAIGHYQTVQRNLQQVADLFPFPWGNEIDDEERCRSAVKYLGNAKKVEESGLRILEKILGEL